MSTIIQSVAIAGASGSLGAPITHALLDAGFVVTALTRQGSRSTFPEGVKVVAVDYASSASLQSALSGQDALISTIAQAFASEQARLLEAAAAVGVRRLIPSEFGSDTTNPQARALPVYKDKVADQELVQRLCASSDGKTTYTFIFNNAFLDWGITHEFLINARTKTFTTIDGGEGIFTTTPLSFVGAGVVAVLKRPEQTANKTVNLQGARLSQRKFLEIVQRATGGEQGWTVTDVKSEQLEKDSYTALKADPANVPAWLFGMLKLAIFAEGFGGDYGEKGERDNAMLGLKTLTQEEVEQVVRSVV